ncbi:MAG TPA: hypothetical protein VJH03_12630 [Blastocatellia bacterium]|nr:hypothetical protein [Blastocatellia bacterium]
MMIALIGGREYAGLSGFAYSVLLAPTLTAFHWRMGRRRRKLMEAAV